jgi:hypothetical protein
MIASIMAAKATITISVTLLAYLIAKPPTVKNAARPHNAAFTVLVRGKTSVWGSRSSPVRVQTQLKGCTTEETAFKLVSTQYDSLGRS